MRCAHILLAHRLEVFLRYKTLRKEEGKQGTALESFDQFWDNQGNKVLVEF